MGRCRGQESKVRATPRARVQGQGRVRGMGKGRGGVKRQGHIQGQQGQGQKQESKVRKVAG